MRRILAVILPVAFIAVGCSDSNPSTPSPLAAPSFPAASTGATISGTIGGTSGGGSASTNAVRPDAGPAGIVVTVAGSGQSATVDGTGRFVLLNVPAGTIALQFTGPGVGGTVTVANVAAGQTIELTLQITGTTVSLEADRRASGSEEQVEGRVEALPASPAGTLVVAGRTISTDANTRIVSGNQTMTFAALAIGQRVHVKGTTNGTSLLASLIDIQNTNTTLPANVNGIITALGTPFGPAAFTFFVGTTEVRGGTTTEFFGGSAFTDLVVGARVEVKGQPGNGFVQALRIHVNTEDDDDDDDDATAVIVQATGAVSALSGKCPVIQFTVGTQTFKANGGTTFVNTTCAAVAAGMNVTATGEATGGGFAVATQVTKN